jgi:hypothetical protein
MSDAIKEAIEAMDKSKPYMSAYSPDRKMIDKAIAALHALQSGEPVAWQFYQDGEWYMGMPGFHRANTIAAGFATRDLYTTPQPVVDVNQQAIEALKECISVIEREQYDYEYRGTCAAANDAIEALQALQSGGPVVDATGMDEEDAMFTKKTPCLRR